MKEILYEKAARGHGKKRKLRGKAGKYGCDMPINGASGRKTS